MHKRKPRSWPAPLEASRYRAGEESKSRLCTQSEVSGSTCATEAWNGAIAAYAPHRRRLWSHHRGARASEGRAQRGVQQLGGAAREKIWNRSQEEVEALRRDPIRSFTFIDLSSKRGVTRPKAKAEGRAAGGDLGARPHSCN